MKLTVWLALHLFTTFALAMVQGPAFAQSYKVVIKEGAFKFDTSGTKPLLKRSNRYLAQVEVYVDGGLVGTFRGSTLADSSLVYERWHMFGETESPNDKQVVAMMEQLERLPDYLKKLVQIGQLDLTSYYFNLDEKKKHQPIAFMPIIPSGTYQFSVGLHKKGNSIHGQPYALRLLGGPIDAPYDATNINYVQKWSVGGFLTTLNKNYSTKGSHKGKYLANGINVHDGRKNAKGHRYRDSEGCITIHPDHWKKFIGLFPKPGDWKGVGELVLVRN